MKENKIKYCKCGCGQIVKNKFVTGHWLRTNNPMKTNKSKTKYKEFWKNNPEKLKERNNKIKQNWKHDFNRKKQQSDRMKTDNPRFLEERFGEKAPAWKGGSSFAPYPIEFNKKLKLEIRKRDKFICQNTTCRRKSSKEVHHINYNKQDNRNINLITLCRKCHSLSNFNRPYWTNFYNKIIQRKQFKLKIYYICISKSIILLHCLQRICAFFCSLLK